MSLATDDVNSEGEEIDMIATLIDADEEQGIKVSSQLQCIQSLAEKNSLFRSSLAFQNFMLLAPQLKKKFEKYKVGPLQRALFYSQIIHETQQFARLSEVTSKGLMCWRHLKNREGSACANSQDCVILDNIVFDREKPWLTKYRGRGLIHLTGCDTYVSALHFHNTGKWRAYWPVKSQPPKNCPKSRCPPDQLGMNCSKENVAEIKKWYQKKYNKQLDPTDLLNKPEQLSYSCNVKNGKLENPVNDLLVDSSFAFWKGKCTDHISAVPQALNILKHLGPIQGFAGLNSESKKAHIQHLKNNHKVDQAINKVTKCVNGGTNGLADRKKWFFRALQCVH